jgi:hypothetical protein
MKRIAYFFLLIVIMSCGSDMFSSKNHIRLQIRDSTIRDFYLLSVRQNSFIVSPYKEEAVTIDSLLAGARSIPFEKTAAITYRLERSISILPGLGGCLIGTIGGCVAGGYASKQEGDIGTWLAYGGAGGLFGFTAGMLIATALQNSDERILYEVENNVEELRNLAIYPNDEPPELQKIK